ncbi:MAG: hypothetical protein JRH11_23390 [Deltaproteobacteria bacterium]|nr:hypothetical protein [Deltaproteobacteria bacterium]
MIHRVAPGGLRKQRPKSGRTNLGYELAPAESDMVILSKALAPGCSGNAAKKKTG